MICDKWLHIYGNKLGTGINCEWVDDVRENVKGEWIDRGKDMMIRWQCSECGRKDIHIYNFCPDCGADMREVNYELETRAIN